MAKNKSMQVRQNSSIQKAIAFSKRGDSKQALKVIQSHLRKFPHDIGALNLAATFAASIEEWLLAEKYLASVLDIDKNNIHAIYNLFKVFNLTMRLDEAAAMLSRVLEIDPNNTNALNEKGVMLSARGDMVSALQAFDKCIQIDPLFEMGYKNLYAALVTCARYEEAVHIAKLAIQRIATDYRYQFKVDLIVCLWRSYAYQEGRLAAEEIIAELTRLNDPKHNKLLARACANYGTIFMELNEVESAQEQYLKAISLDPENIDPYINLAKTYWFVEDISQALHWFYAALAIEPNKGELHLHLGIVLRDAGRPELALPYLQSAVVQSPANPELRYYLGITQFALGQLEQAYENYELRWTRREGGVKSQLAIPEWAGYPESGRSILVYKEQGLGDELLFATCIPDLIDRFERVVYICNWKLKTLLTRSFPQIEFRDWDSVLAPEDLGGVDFQIPIGSLPRIFRRKIEDFPGMRQLLIPEAEKVSLFRKRWTSSGNKLIVGIGWRSTVKSINRRSVYPQLEFWGALFGLQNIVWVNLQYGDVDEEIRKAEQDFGISIINFEDVDHYDDLDTSAALMKACDMVIGPDNSTTTIAAAVGVPSIRISPYTDYLCLGTDHYPWFPNMVLAKRHLGETWEMPIQRVADIVRALAAERAQEAVDMS